MKETTLGPYRSIAAGLLGAGLFSVLYPAIVWLFAPRRVFAVHHVVFLCAGLVLLLLGAVGRQWELPGAVARRDRGRSVCFSARRGILTPPRNRAFWPDRSPSCALSGHREAAVLSMLSEAVRSALQRFPPSDTPPSFSTSPSARPLVRTDYRGEGSLLTMVQSR